ncbi:hypothetical protein [Gallaecimonas mangrovi]|nr:hypothetical protein [Gallaecimonas mangrovi]
MPVAALLLAAFSGFVVHFCTREWLQHGLSVQMQRHPVAPSWSVR